MMNVQKKLEIKSFDFEIKNVSDDGEFSGLAAPFEIADERGDVLKIGCAAYSIQCWHKSGRLPAMFFNHDAGKNIGAWRDIRECNNGIVVKGQIETKSHYGQTVCMMMKNKIITGLSIGFYPILEKKTMTARYFYQIDLREISVVQNPAYKIARIC